MWINENLLKEQSKTVKKIDKWIPAPPQENVLWKLCSDCGNPIYEMESCWPLADRTVCVWGGCWKKYHEQGQGYHDCAALDLGIALQV